MFELLVYCYYLYFLIILGITIKPKRMIILLLFLYVFYTTWNLYIGCNGLLVKNIYTKTLLTLCYSCFCTISYYYLYYTYDNSIRYKIFLMFVPVLYYVAIKVGEQLFIRKKHHTINFPFVLLKSFLN
jgi:hypothetical protein